MVPYAPHAVIYKNSAFSPFSPYGSHNIQRLFPYTALTGWALERRRNMFPVRSGLNVYINID
jgi:hypothetical protein